MKALELNWNRPFQDRHGDDWYVWGETCVRPWIANMYGQSKRLTDAELAAEVFSAVFHEAECEVRGRKLAAQYPAHPAIDQWAAHNHEFGRQADILRRFATLPNYVVIEAAFTFGPITRDEHEWLTVNRFATLPHYDEESQ